MCYMCALYVSSYSEVKRLYNVYQYIFSGEGEYELDMRYIFSQQQLHLTPGLLDSEVSIPLFHPLLHPLRIPITCCWKDQVIWIWNKCSYDMESSSTLCIHWY
jgi:hypothetical protein